MRVDLGVVTALGALYLLWGSVFVAVRYVVDVAPPFLSIGARYLVSGLVIALWAVSHGGWQRLALDRRTALACLLLAVLLPVL
jgi:drug/metabolite transporter (DMT)-like permease